MPEKTGFLGLLDRSMSAYLFWSFRLGNTSLADSSGRIFCAACLWCMCWWRDTHKQACHLGLSAWKTLYSLRNWRHRSDSHLPRPSTPHISYSSTPLTLWESTAAAYDPSVLVAVDVAVEARQRNCFPLCPLTWDWSHCRRDRVCDSFVSRTGAVWTTLNWWAKGIVNLTMSLYVC